MLSGDDAIRARVLADRLEVLAELRALASEIDRIEQRYGPHRIIEDTRRRVQVVRGTVLAKLQRALALETKH
jgi:hypothetical protein